MVQPPMSEHPALAVIRDFARTLMPEVELEIRVIAPRLGTCVYCGDDFVAHRKTKRTCGNRCRVALSRRNHAEAT